MITGHNVNRFLFVLGVFFIAIDPTAAGRKPPKDTPQECVEALSGTEKPTSIQPSAEPSNTVKNFKAKPFRVIPSPRAPQDAKVYEEYIRELMELGGIIDRLGIKMTGQVIEFTPPRDLNAVTAGTASGYPVSHYLDGAAVLNSYNPRQGFALEVVYPGKFYQHGFYRDDNPAPEQISIIDHVIGHNNFAMMSGLKHYQYGQGLEATKNLDRILTQAYQDYNKDDVMRYYLWVQTLAKLWEWYTPLFESPEDFKAQSKFKTSDKRRSASGSVPYPKRPTENILAAFAANLDPSEPAWKTEILESIFTSKAFIPALNHTQIMNEGWASLTQELLPKHSKNNHNFSYWFTASQVMQKESRPDLSDPYSLGAACWRRIFERYLKTPEMQKLKTVEEKDRALFAYAEELIQTMTDEDFLRFAIDQTFVDRFHLAILKKLPYEQWKPLQPSDDKKNNWQWRIKSKKVDEVVQMIIDRILKPKYFFNPRVKLVDFNRPGTGEVELILDDNLGVTFPLNKMTLAPSLYALAQTIDRPMSLVATLTAVSAEYPTPQNGPRRHPLQTDFEAVRARIVVGQNGDVKVYRITDDRRYDEISLRPPEGRMLSEVFDPNLSRFHTEVLANYLNDLYLEDSKEAQRVFDSSPGLKELLVPSITAQIDAVPYDGMVTQSPNSAGAILEYKQMLQRRLARALELAATRKGGIIATSRGMRIKALPSVVNLSYDRNYISAYKSGLNDENDDISIQLLRAPGLITAQNPRHSPFGPLDTPDSGVGGVRGEEGDQFWGPSNPGAGEGEEGKKPTDDGNDLSWVDVPADLYKKYIGEKIKLPFFNRKPGANSIKGKRQGGHIRRRQGVLIPDQILPNVFKRGVGGLISEGVEDPLDDFDEAIDVGFEYLQGKDIVVKSNLPSRVPDTKAVVVFVLDGSASTAEYFDAFKRFINDIENLIAANYKGFEFRYIIFDGQAKLLKNKAELFRAKLGGGTEYSSGIDLTESLFAQSYNREEWDRVTFLLGDMDDFSPQKAFNKIKSLIDQSEYFGVVAGLFHEDGELNGAITAEAANNPKLGYTRIDDDGGYRLENLKEVLKQPAE